MKNIKKTKKKLYSILASLSCLNIGASASSKTPDVDQMDDLNGISLDNSYDDNLMQDSSGEKNLDSDALADPYQPLKNIHNKSLNEKSSAENDLDRFDNKKTQITDSLSNSYQLALEQRRAWEERMKKNPLKPDEKNPTKKKNTGDKNGFLKTAVDVGAMMLTLAGVNSVLHNAWPATKSLLRYRYKKEIRQSKKLLDLSKSPGIANDYQCIFADASIPDKITISNDSIPCLNKEFQPDVMHLYKSTQIFKDDGEQKRTISFGENIKTPNHFVIQKKQGPLVLELSKENLKNGIKVYVKADDLELKLHDISDLKTDSNWGITIYETNGLTLFLDVPKNKIKKASLDIAKRE